MPERGRLPRTLIALGVALAAGAALLFGAPARSGAPQPLALATAWPDAQRGSVPSRLPDGSEYSPALFLDARTSAGTVQSVDGRTLRLILRQSDGSIRQLRKVPSEQRAPFAALTGSGDTLVWVESVDGRQQLWRAGLRGNAPARMITAEVGAMRLRDSQYDLVIADAMVHWVAAGPGERTEFRSVPLTGGRVTVERAAGSWSLSAWPWAVDGQTSARGVTALRDLTTGRTAATPSAARAITACSPSWCRMVSLNADGYARIELAHPDGSARRKVAEGAVATAIEDVAVLDRFEVFGRVGPQSELSGNQELLVHDLRTRRTVLVSPDAGNVGYRGGVLWWSTGDQSSFVRNSLDLRTV
ncbi:hypothetical protein [Actinoplanes teichomyceticus]|uniref:WD40 repeat protein n=1 Tax=Actinoplanes teichomyceticus TaxID=1867 RepID=A0A561VCE6_ACTTI|nr:hypothetical protein [Actinoplanes teichomyceticus]TWG09291.1 hypothetical protein FHX34_1086 [Actinoplanes teichomyceticus]GIF16687.1 hypothetical protein Ate01nite_67190 [Actinoplanes teichomyceticus]